MRKIEHKKLLLASELTVDRYVTGTSWVISMDTQIDGVLSVKCLVFASELWKDSTIKDGEECRF